MGLSQPISEELLSFTATVRSSPLVAAVRAGRRKTVIEIQPQMGKFVTVHTQTSVLKGRWSSSRASGFASVAAVA